MDERVIKKLRKSEIKILDEIVRICEKHNLKYFLMGGTLLGAVRHKGFIPWDDDLDIAMPRDDYEKFLDIAIEELSDDFEVDDIRTNENYNLIFAKIRLKNSLFLAGYCKEEYIKHNGIWVDVFPFDESKHNRDLFIKMKWSHIRLLKAIYIRNTELVSMKKHHLTNFLQNFYKNVPQKKLNRRIYKKITSENHRKGNKYYINYGSQYGVMKQTHLKTNLFPLKKITFEGKKYCVPNNYKEVLRTIYGDNYMQLPPKEKQITHNPYKLVFEDGEEISFNEKV